MAPKYYPTPKPTLNEVKEKFKNWRKTRKSPRPIPKELWDDAIKLTSHHSISQISKELVLDYSYFKERVSVKEKNANDRIHPPNFIELNLEPPAAVSECIIEMEGVLGTKMRMHFKGKADIDLLELAKAFWGRQP
jgi:hypothetical protein